MENLTDCSRFPRRMTKPAYIVKTGFPKEERETAAAMAAGATTIAYEHYYYCCGLFVVVEAGENIIRLHTVVT